MDKTTFQMVTDSISYLAIALVFVEVAFAVGIFCTGFHINS